MTERRSLDPSAEEMRRLGHEAVDRLVEHLATLSDQRVAKRGTAAELAALVDEPSPAAGAGAADSLKFFFERVVPRMTRVNHPRFHAYIPCPGSFYGTLGEMLAAGTNPFVGSWLGGATISSLELTVLRWIAEAVGYDVDAPGILTSGGSLANLSALAAARAAAEMTSGDFAAARLYVSKEGHASVEKAAAILGFPGECVRRVPVDTRLRMDAAALVRMVDEDAAAARRPWVVAANAGTTNTGAIDPLPAIASLCAERGMWFHVDAAYGGFAAVTEDGRRKLAGMERADSLTLDPHKWLYAPMGTGCVLVRRRGALDAAFAASGEYLKDLPDDEVNFLNRGPELSRPARVLGVWMLLRAAGWDVIRAHVEEDVRLARLAWELLAEDERLELFPEPELSVVAFRLRRRDGETEAQRAERDTVVMEKTLAEGVLMMSSTRLAGESWLRFVVMNHRTGEADVRRSIAAIREAVE